ncbi:MAG: hypothetical protein IPI88_14445 [Chitinophagaceae bacterium]|nr:hypothetical protein [Chitinophagaceae bacterium]
MEKAKEKIEKQLEKIGDNIEPTPLSSQLPAFQPIDGDNLINRFSNSKTG